MAREGDYNFEGSGLERGINPEPRDTPGGYASTYLDKTKIATPEPTGESAVSLGNTEGGKTLENNYNFEGSDLDRGVNPGSRETEDGYGSSLLDKTKVPTPAPQSDSAVTLQNTEGAETLPGNFNFEGSDLDRGAEIKSRESKEDGYGSTLLDKTKIPTPAPQSESAITLGNTEGSNIVQGNYNFERSDLDRGVTYEPKDTDGGGYLSTYLDKTKVAPPNPSDESAVTLGNTEGKQTKEGDYNFEGSDLDRGVDSSNLLEKTKIETPPPAGESAVTLGSST